ncbi:MAG: amino acid permease [Candidatus Glassbacteria bacterium]
MKRARTHREKLSRDMGVSSATMIGVGAMIGAGIFVLTGMAAGTAGPALWLVFLLNGAVTLLTAMVYAELGSSFHDAGGGYLWVKEALPNPNGFLSGWMSWFAHMVACSLYALGFGAYFSHMLIEMGFHFSPQLHSWLPKGLAVLIVLLFSLVNYRGASETGLIGIIVTGLKIVVLGLFIVFGLSRIIGNPENLSNFTPFMPNGWGGIFVAMGLTYIAFEGYEIIAQCSEEVRDPRRNIPRAVFWSIGIVVPIYMMIAFVSIGAIHGGDLPVWKYLGIKKEVAMVEAARQLMPLGAIILLVGGLFSTASALNATIYSSSRVSFAMGRDHNLPESFGKVHREKKTPHIAIFISTLFIIFMAVAFPIEDVASAADIMFLLLFLLVNLSIINLRRTRPDLKRGFTVPLFPWVPIFAIITQFFLAVYMFHYSSIAWYATGIWIALGLSVYFGYSKLKEEKEKASEVIHIEKEIVESHYHIVVPIAEDSELNPLMVIASSIAKSRNGDLTALAVVEMPHQTPISHGRYFLDEKKQLVLKADKWDEVAPVSTMVRISHDVAVAIHDTVTEDEADLVILGWKGYSRSKRSPLGSVLDAVLKSTPADLGIVMLREIDELNSILLPTAGGPNARLAAGLAASLAKTTGARLTSMVIIDKDARAQEEKMKLAVIDATMEGIELEGISFQKKAIRAKSVIQGIVDESIQHDLVMIGASREPIWKRMFLGTIPKDVARRSTRTVMMVKRYEGPILSWFKKFFSG